MKKKMLVPVLLLVIPLLAGAQPLKKKLVPEKTNQQVTTFQVLSKTNDTSERKSKVGTFQLKAGEQKAVAVTGEDITKLDHSFSSLMKEDSVSPTGVFMLPELYYSKVEGTGKQISYRIVFVDQAPLKYDFSRELFEGNIRFLPVEVNGNEGSQQIPKPLSTPEEIIISFGSSSVPVSISMINWPPLDVSITSPDPRDSVDVKILTVSNPAGYLKKLPVEPAIILSSARKTIQGLGVQSLPLHVSLKGVSACKPLMVTLETSLGSLNPATVTLSGEASQEVTIRSESIGNISLRTTNHNYRSNTLSLKAVFPWLFLVLAIAGGVIGTTGQTLYKKEKITLRPLAYGGIIGLIAAVAYWGLGIVLIGFSVETRGLNEIMVFGFGLLAGYFGLKAAVK